MATDPFSASIIPFEVPEQMRALAEKGVSQARDNYAKFKNAAESHNGHSGWHMVACYRIDRQTCHIKFVHNMCAVLNGHTHSAPDWTYVGSKVNVVTGSRRTETYNTNLIGTTKLRDGSVFLEPTVVNFKRWRAKRLGDKPSHALS